MSVFLYILNHNIIPILVLVILGYLLGKKFELSIYTLSKLNFFIFVPAFIFVNLYTTSIPQDMLKVVAAVILLLLLNMIMVLIYAKIRGFHEGYKNAFTNSVLFANTGNIGVPLITLVFSSPPFFVNGTAPYLALALTAQVMVLVVQDTAMNTLGFFYASKANTHWKNSVLKVLKMPAIYCVLLAVILKSVPYDITLSPVWPALEYAKNALVSVALITLGVQLSMTTFALKNPDAYMSALMRLLVSPVLALFVIHMLDLQGVVAQVVMITAALPTAVNTALIAVECDNYPDFASQAVMISTFLGALSLVLIIFLARLLFPVV
ncbi:MAG TPA: AEC family transporter [Syntrophomonas sp.]|nr:AEC family transporter [Syntrophomonas sp.]